MTGDGTATVDRVAAATGEATAAIRPVLGIVGAGKVGTVLARLAVQAGYRVLIAGSGDPAAIALIISVLAPGAQAVRTEDLAREADVVVLALPLGRFRELPADAFDGALVLDAMNYWWESDGDDEQLGGPGASTSELVQHHLPGARVVKALNHLGYHDLDERGRPAGAPDRVAVALAGDDPRDVRRAAEIVDDLGFDPLPVQGLRAGVAVQPFTRAFGAVADREGLRELVEGFPATDRGRDVLRALEGAEAGEGPGHEDRVPQITVMPRSRQVSDLPERHPGRG